MHIISCLDCVDLLFMYIVCIISTQWQESFWLMKNLTATIAQFSSVETFVEPDLAEQENVSS